MNCKVLAMSTIDVKLFRDLHWDELPDYIYTPGRNKPRSRLTTSTSTLPGSKMSCRSRHLDSRNYSVTPASRGLSTATVNDIATKICFDEGVIEDRAPTLSLYYPDVQTAGLYNLPSDLQAARNARRPKGAKSIIQPPGHLPCVLGKSEKTEAFRQVPCRSGDAKSSYSPSEWNTYSNTTPSDRSDQKARVIYEDEKFLTGLSYSTIDLIVSKMTFGLQQDRLRRRFNLTVPVGSVTPS